jgi:type II secretory pathway pseudopilin PulG
MTLLELVVAFTIFGILMLGIAHTMGTGLGLTRTNRHRSVAANLASQQMDTVRSTDFAAISNSTTSVDVDGIEYSVETRRQLVPKSSTNGPCDGTADPAVLRVDVRVTWTDMNGIPPVESNTIITPPVGSYDPLTGHIGIKVFDRDADPVFNAPVTIAGQGTEYTNTDGCAFFAFLPAGSYTVQLGTVGWVDRQSNATPSQVVGVTIGNTSNVQFDYDEEATFDVSFVSDLGYAPPASLDVTVYNPQLLPNGRKAIAGTGSPRSVTGLFPFLEGFQMWAGRCADSDPEFFPGGSRGDTLDAVAGAVTPATVRLRDAEITVVDAGGVPIAGALVHIEHGEPYSMPAPPPDSVCASGTTYEAGTTGATTPGRLDAALPYGTWTITVDGRLPVGAWPVITLDPTGTGPVVTTVTVQ